jgi:hypothetical protein
MEGHWVALSGQNVAGPGGQPVLYSGQTVLWCGQKVVSVGQAVVTLGQTVEVFGVAVGACARMIAGWAAVGPEGSTVGTSASRPSMRSSAVFNVFAKRGESWVSSASEIPDQAARRHRRIPSTTLRPMAISVPSLARVKARVIRRLTVETAQRTTFDENRPTPIVSPRGSARRESGLLTSQPYTDDPRKQTVF